MDIKLKPQVPTFVESDEPMKENDLQSAGHSSNTGIDPSDAIGNGTQSIQDIEVEWILHTKVNHCKNLEELAPIEALAIFNRLIDDLVQLSKLTSRKPSVDLDFLLFTPTRSHGKGPNLPHSMTQEAVQEVVLNKQFESDQDIQQDRERYEVPLKISSKLRLNFGNFSAAAETGATGLKNGEVLGHSPDDMKTNDQRLDRYVLCRSLPDTGPTTLRKFYLKKAPSLQIPRYLERIHHYANLSTATLLTSAYYLFHLTFNLKAPLSSSLLPLKQPQTPEGFACETTMLQINDLNAFRLVLSVLRLSLKLIEDKNYKQSYYCKVTGLQSVEELFKLELNLLYLLNFNLFVNEIALTRFLFQFQQFDSNLRNILS
ncbi:hypothetical protein KL921_000545 [Ogataea angusta]|uniref:Uncharacterized protein n=1 Tax=Pichia angusta TaxID=870730 RepID=A0ABQ7RQG7_PICAN|nr:hypothetical protein KL921_000545 [Ogataea angusta]KAG7827764.1 hypothetical protein KL920_004014 [Ogataea angusta]KAG7835724.1 hypothetical protein KL942_005090 [Ogataea angusta]KAG7837061.1 hypothetical protein KL943_001100 [Ogataea angusta]KAG7845823.1 hypothetical protein KL940_005050 [Ogataea angusta]